MRKRVIVLRMKVLFRSAILLFITGISISVPFLVYLELQAPLLYAKEESFVVTREDSKDTVILKLLNEGFIKNTSAFRVALFIQNGETYVAPGGYELSKSMNAWGIAKALSTPSSKWITLEEGFSKTDLSVILGNLFEWSEAEKLRFVRALAAIQWDRFNEDLIDIIASKLDWSEPEKKTFSSMSAFFSDTEYDFLRNAYDPGDYLLPLDASYAQLANIFVSRFAKEHIQDLSAELRQVLDTDAISNVMELVRGSVELLPDLTPLPPSDIDLVERNGRALLVFTTTYWNQGKGPFELVADPKTKDIKGDVERSVSQRIYRIDGEHRDHLVGNFLWEQRHLHYHFGDFVDFILESIDGTGEVSKTKHSKVTFCIRDVDSIDTNIEGAPSSAAYRICGKERQGISIGWGDSYFFTYIFQNIDVTNLPKGRYRLTFKVNPQGRFEEVSINNNESSVLLDLDVIEDAVTVIEGG